MDYKITDQIEQELISLNSPSQWKKALTNINHSFGHTWESCYAMYLTTGSPTFLYTLKKGNAKIICPIAERSYEDHTDVYTPYGFSGFAGNCDFPDFQKYWKAFVQERGYVCGYMGLNPLWENETYYDASELHKSNTLYVLDLRLSMAGLYKNLCKDRKQNLKRYDKFLPKIITDKKLLKSFFLTNCHAFFEKRNASSVYNFTSETLSCIIDTENVVAVGLYDKGEVKAISLFAFTPHCAEYLFNISTEEGRQYTVPLLWYGVNYLKAINIPLLNLGGGIRENDGVAKFKQRFGGMNLPLHCLKQIYDRESYGKLCVETNNDPNDLKGYFPAYRNLNLVWQS